MTQCYSESELRKLGPDELVEVVIQLQEKNKKLEADIDALRGEVAFQAIEQEMQEENEINSFRRLSIECAAQGIPVDMPQQRAGASIDQCGSLTNCVTRSEPAIVSLSSYTSTSSTPAAGKFVAGSMRASIEQMSNSLSAQNLLKPQAHAAPAVMRSFTQGGLAPQSQPQPRPALGAAPAQPRPPAAPAQLQPRKITVPAVEEDDGSDSDVVI